MTQVVFVTKFLKRTGTHFADSSLISRLILDVGHWLWITMNVENTLNILVTSIPWPCWILLTKILARYATRYHGPNYGCAPCEFYVHDSCRELDREIQHPLHSLYSLTLRETDDESSETCSSCNASGFDVKGFHYCWDECKFVLHLGYAFLWT